MRHRFFLGGKRDPPGRLLWCAAVVFNLIGLSYGYCRAEGYFRTRAQARCSLSGYFQAYTESTPNGVLTVCCPRGRDFTNERNNIRACRTTSCVTTGVAPCSTLNEVFIDGRRLQQDYEHTINDTCTVSPRGRGVASVCCPRGTVDSLHYTVSAAERNEFPHMASLGGCGGTVYNSEFVITAAHCLVNDEGEVRDVDDWDIIIGTNMGSSSSRTNAYRVAEIIVHQNYSGLANHSEILRSYQRIYNDIALLRLQNPIDFQANPTIKSLEIAPENFRPEDFADQVIIAGWGTTGLAIATQHLQKSDLLFRDDPTCFDRRRGPLGRDQYDIMEYADQLLCVGGIVNNSVSNEAGRGDSGGPSICRGPDGYGVLCGVTSFGSEFWEEQCSATRTSTFCKPSVYADVGYFRQWIIDNAGEQDPATFHRKIVYGKEAPQGQYSHQVHIRTSDGKKCGGTLVSQDTVVTAASCVFTDDKKQRPGIKVDTLIRDITQRSKNVFTPKKIIHAPNFSRYRNIDSLNNTRSGRMLIRDPAYADNLAVIKLNKKTNVPQFARLPRGQTYTPGPAKETAFPLDTRRSGVLVERNFTILEPEECRRRLDRFAVLNIDVQFDTNKVMCGVEEYSGGSLCDRELGGGLMCKDSRGRETFCGVQTFRMCETTLPSAFLFTGHYRDLIRSMTMETDDN